MTRFGPLLLVAVLCLVLETSSVWGAGNDREYSTKTKDGGFSNMDKRKKRNWSRPMMNTTKTRHDDLFSSKLTQPKNPSSSIIMVVDVRSVDPPLQMAILSCVGLFNRNDSIAGPAYAVWEPYDLDWLREIEGMAYTNPNYTSPKDFLTKCLGTVANQRYIHYNYETQQPSVPNILTLAGVLNAIPLTPSNTMTTALIHETNSTMVFDAEKELAGKSVYDVTEYMFNNYANQTTTMSKMDPGYDYSKSYYNPPCTNHPRLRLADYVVKERLFNIFLLEGCIPYTKEHSLMEIMTQRDHPNIKQWQQPIVVMGYDDVVVGPTGDPWEAETTCVKSHNMGQVATDNASCMSFWSRKPVIDKPMVQNQPSPPSSDDKQQEEQDYNSSMTYIALVVGDGDNIGMVKTRNYDWVQQRMAYCHNESMAPYNCFPISWTISPHMLYLAPDILRWFYSQAKNTTQDFFLLPPSGYLYSYPSLMQEDDQARFVERTEETARLLNSSGSVAWEWTLTWGGAIKNYFPRYATKSIVRGLFAVNVPFNAPIGEFGRNEHYKLIRRDNGTVVLFNSREWRGTSGRGDVPFSRKEYMTPQDMAAEINGYDKGTVCYIYLTSDGGADLDTLYSLVPLLQDHVKVVNHETVTDMALQRSAKQEHAAAALDMEQTYPSS
jgi:GxGYxYP putative glycoside hydrolase C-terminal domain